MEILTIVLNFNDYITCKRLIDKIKNFKVINKIIIVDNCSTDNSYKELQKLMNEKVDVIRTDKNGGYAYGNNYGIEYGIKKYNPKYIIISNPDIEFKEDVVEVMKAYLDKSDNVASVNPKIINLDGSNANSSWKLPTFKKDLVSMFTITELFLKKNASKKISNKSYEKKVILNEVLSGCFFMIKADVMKEIGYFDERTFLYCEERILGKKIKDIGMTQATLTEIECIHAHSISINKNISSTINKYKILFKSRKIYYRYYLNFSRIKLIFFDLISFLALIEKRIIIFLLSALKGDNE